MVSHIFKLLSPIIKVADDGGSLKIAGYASTADTDRVGDVILPDAWTKNGGLENFKKNPIILFNHNYNNPIGRAVEIEVDSVGLKITCEISKGAGNTYELIKDAALTTFSVGFLIKDADYNQITDGYIIKEAELLEVSVVSVPCNQAAIFSISKSLKSEELVEFNREVNALKGLQLNELNGSEELTPPKTGADALSENKKMDEDAVKAMTAEIVKNALAADAKARTDAAEQLAARAAEETRINEAVKVAATAATKSVEERLMAEFGEKLKTNNEDLTKTLDEMKSALEEKSVELAAMRENKHQFIDRNTATDWSKDKNLLAEADNAFMLSKVLGKRIEDTDFGKKTVEKFNTHSTVTVGTDALERTVGTQIEMDIWNELVLAPLFNEIQMNSATMTFPIMPDAGYAEITANTAASGTAPNGNMDPRGAGYGAPYTGITLTEQTLSVIKMISKSYLGNETEEDSLIPILPLIRESMIRAHARGVENMFLAGNHVDGVYTAGAANGLLAFANTGGRNITQSGTYAAAKLTAAQLFSLRQGLGKYGINPRDVVYIVSQTGYFQLIQDAEFADADLVGASNATKLTGEVGLLYGSKVLMCDEFAAPALGKYNAIAVNTRNFLVPRLRGVTVESDYIVEDQRRVLVTSQRLGFAEKIPNAPSVMGLKYPTA